MRLLLKTVLLFVVVFIGNAHSFSQSKIDSLDKVLRNEDNDSIKFSLYNSLARLSLQTAPEKSMQYAREMFVFAVNRKNKLQEGMSLNIIGIIHRNLGNYDSAMHYYNVSLKIREELNDKKGIGASHNNLGLLDFHRGNYSNAIEHFLVTLKIYESMTDSMGSITHRKAIAQANNNLALVHHEQGNYDKALQYYLEFFKINEMMNDKHSMGVSLNNIGVVYEKKKDFKNAMDYFTRSIEVRKEIGDKRGIADCLNNLGSLYSDMKQNEKSLDYNLQALRMREELEDKGGVALSHNNIARLFVEMKNFNKAIDSYSKSLELGKEMGDKDIIMGAYSGLATSYAGLEKFEKAYSYHQEYADMRDSILNEESLKQQHEMEAKYESEKKNTQIDLLKKQQEIKKLEQESELSRQKQWRNTFIVGFISFFIIAFVLYNRNQFKQKANVLLEKHNKLIEEKNKDITDSIRYAKRIQEAIFPPEELIKKLLPDSFIFYKPKDIVSGDFYWVEHTENKILFAAVDCTGHGVPGAFMSIVGNNLLNEAVHEYRLSKPSHILDFLNKGVSSTLRQEVENSKVKDGMDIALCAWDKKENKLEFSGANNPIYFARENQLNIVLGDRHSIGIFLGEEIKQYKNNEMQIQKGDVVYIFSDGLADQFGGEKGKKFKYKRLRELLLSIHSLPMDEQKELLDRKFEEWKGNFEQVDDVLVIGVRV